MLEFGRAFRGCRVYKILFYFVDFLHERDLWIFIFFVLGLNLERFILFFLVIFREK